MAQSFFYSICFSLFMIDTIKDVADRVNEEIEKLVGKKLYKKLDTAIASNKEQTIWALSKIISNHKLHQNFSDF
jgi:uncharacterized protein YbcI